MSHPAPGPARAPSILIVEDHPIVRRGMRDILAEHYPDAAFGEAGDSREAQAALAARPWDVVLLDINIPGRDGLEILEDIRRAHPGTKVLVASAYPEAEFAVRSFKLGASGFLSKSQAPDELVAAVGKLLAGGRYVAASLAEALAGALDAERAGGDPHLALSPRELQVLRLVAEGRSVKEIAGELALSEKTIGTYRVRIAQKIGVSSNVELTRYAFRHGLTT